MNNIQLEDCKNIGALEFIDWERFINTTILITGATGLIGSNLVYALAYNSQEKELNIKLVLLVRNVAIAESIFDFPNVNIIKYELGDKLKIDEQIDYIVNLASPTSSKYFIDNPVDTMLENIEGCKVLLDWAKNQSIRKYVGLSTMEVYGFPRKGHKVKEDELGSFETMNVRNSYPIAKLACEMLSYSYYIQYKIPTVILRATQTFGPGVKYNDGRVFAQFMRCAVEKKDIVLKSSGLTERPYLYTADAVSAIIVALLEADPGQAYTVANPDTYCSIKDMAQIVTNAIADGEIRIIIDPVDDIEKLGYSKTLYMDLDIEKMKNLGWAPCTRLIDMYQRMISSLE